MTEHKSLNEAILAVMAAVPYIQKLGENLQQKYKFASAEHIVGEVRAAAIEHGLVIGIDYPEAITLPEATSKSGSAQYRTRVKLVVTLYHGTETRSSTFWGEAHDYADKSLSKAETMAMKSALRRLFLIETGENDPDAVTPEETKPEPKKEPAPPYTEWSKNTLNWFGEINQRGLMKADEIKKMIAIHKTETETVKAIKAKLPKEET